MAGIRNKRFKRLRKVVLEWEEYNMIDKCDTCGGKLDWNDTLNYEGSLIEGWVIEHMLYKCKECGTQYLVDADISFTPNQVNFTKEKA